MSEVKVKGACLCGAVSYESDVEPFVTLVCHCVDCQRSSGAPHVAVTFLPKDEVEVEGELKRFALRGSSGMMTERLFCPECGSTVMGVPGPLPQFLAICTGTLEDSSWVKPDLHCWTRSKQAWDKVDTAALVFDKAPDFKKIRT